MESQNSLLFSSPSPLKLARASKQTNKQTSRVEVWYKRITGRRIENVCVAVVIVVCTQVLKKLDWWEWIEIYFVCLFWKMFDPVCCCCRSPTLRARSKNWANKSRILEGGNERDKRGKMGENAREKCWEPETLLTRTEQSTSVGKNKCIWQWD